MQVTTNSEISYSVRLRPSEVRHIHQLLEEAAGCTDYSPLQIRLFQLLAKSIRDQVSESEGIAL